MAEMWQGFGQRHPTKHVLELKNGFCSTGSNLANLLYVLSNIHFLLYYVIN